MNQLVESKLAEVKGLCSKYRVKRLELFGSASTGNFDPQSDLDFLLEFQDIPESDYADAYFGLLADLERLFHRHIDLVMTKAIKNRYFLQGISASRTPLYAA